jgi:nucleoid-associated protein YgaU
VRAIALIGLILLAAIGSAWLLLPEAFPDLRPRANVAINPPPPNAMPPAGTASGTTTAPSAPTVLPSPAPVAPSAPAVRPPRFDVARIGARGTLVTAGRAEPNAEVTLTEGGRELGRARADARGEWVILPNDPLAPGVRELALSARLPGQDPVPGAETVVLLVPERPAVAAGSAAPRADQAVPSVQPGPMAMLLPPASTDAAPRLLQAPLAAADQGRLSVDVVDYDDAGAMRFAGGATPGSTVRLYVDDALLGDSRADAVGRWTLTPAAQPGPGRHLLRADQISAAGAVSARVEVPFQRDVVSQDQLRDGRVVVQPGHSLWRLSRLAYGRGVRYTVIYEANRDQIRDPARIYPGQIFALPAAN